MAAVIRKSGVSLLETVVVTGIMSGLVFGVVLPKLIESRSASQKATCAAHLRQLGQGILNHEAALGIFPSGGVVPWPNVEDYTANGIPLGSEQQGLGWHYQILPYLDDPIEQPVTTKELMQLGPPIFFCPARRKPTFRVVSWNPDLGGYWMNDYAAITAGPGPGQLGAELFELMIEGDVPFACRLGYGYWGRLSQAPGGMDFNPRSSSELGAQYAGFWGVMVRGSYLRQPNGDVKDLDYTPLTKIKSITDGLGRTGILTEKHLRIPYDTLQPGDDRGWSDGFDHDTMRYNFCPPAPDQENLPGYSPNISPGSPHSTGVNVVYANGSVRCVSFDVEPRVWHRIGHRSDGRTFPSKE